MEVSEGRVADDLRYLTALLETTGAEIASGFLGGEYGYGAEYVGTTFEMHPFWWGDCECGHEDREAAWDKEHPHTDECYQTVIRERGFSYDAVSGETYEQRESRNQAIIARTCREMKLDPEWGSHVHCTCYKQRAYAEWQDANPHPKSCPMVRPNFRHYSTGVEVSWYKYIGRDMEVGDIDRGTWVKLMAECEAEVISTK